MLAQTHMFQRGDVWYWRRKARRFSTKIIDLQLSLRTTNRQRAVMIARRVTAESDDVMEAVKQGQMTLEEAKAFLRAVIVRESERLERQRMVIAMDMGPGCPDEDARHDWAHKTAMGLLAKHGIRAMVDPAVRTDLQQQGVSDRHIETLTLALDQIRQELTGDAGVARRAEMFRGVTGRDVSGAVEMLRLLQLQVEGKAAVHAQALPPAAQVMAADIMQEIDLGQIGFQPTEAIQPLQIELIPEKIDAPGASSVPEPVDDPEPEELDSAIEAVLERMIAMKESDDAGLEAKTAQQYRAFGQLLIRATGKEDVRDLRQADAVRFQEVLTKLPTSFGKSPSHHTLSIEEIIAATAKLPVEKIGMSTATRNRYTDHFAALVRAAQNEGIALDPRLNPSALRRRETKRARDKKRTFTEDELKTLFEHPFFNPGDLGKGKMSAFATRRASGRYWVPIICAYTGARREEIAGISLSEVRNEDNLWYFALRHTETRRLKTDASERAIPFHDDLIKLGLVEYIEGTRKLGGPHLFSDLKEPKSHIMGRKPGRLMGDLVEKIWGQEGDGLSLNSMRHYVQHVLDLSAEVTPKVCRDIMGHEGTDIHSTTYGAASPLTSLKAAIDRLPRVLPATAFAK